MLSGVRREIGERLQGLQQIVSNHGLVDRLQSRSDVAREVTAIGQINLLAAKVTIIDALQTAVAPDEAALLMAIRRDLDGDDSIDQLDGNVVLVDADKLAARWEAHGQTRIGDMTDIVIDEIYGATSRHTEPATTTQKA